MADPNPSSSRVGIRFVEKISIRYRRLMCRFSKCLRCDIYETEAGIGGRCRDCGKIYGWMTREELRNG